MCAIPERLDGEVRCSYIVIRQHNWKEIGAAEWQSFLPLAHAVNVLGIPAEQTTFQERGSTSLEGFRLQSSVGRLHIIAVYACTASLS